MGDLAERRLQTVHDHMRLECECDWGAVIATFAFPPGGGEIICKRPFYDPSQIAKALGLG